jgi:hypothetical protein
MNESNLRRRPVDETSLKTLMDAFTSYRDHGQSTMTCESCGSPIEFVKLATEAWQHSCSCGKYDGTMKGL